MTNKEAMDRAKTHLQRIEECRAAGIMVESNVLKTLVTMAQKQIPKKPNRNSIFPSNKKIGLCPVCEWTVTREESYCEQCGQKLDWSVEDD